MDGRRKREGEGRRGKSGGERVIEGGRERDRGG